MDYHHQVNPENQDVNTFFRLLELIDFLRNLSAYHKTDGSGILELYFHNLDKVFFVAIEYDVQDIKDLKMSKSISELSQHIFGKSDQKTRKKLFSNEMINILVSKGCTFKNILKHWDAITIGYKRQVFQQ